MRTDANLALALEPGRESTRAPAASIYLATVCSYLRESGAPTLTKACTSLEELSREVGRLKAECEAILEEAAPHFGAARPTPRKAGPEAAPPRPSKALLVLDRELRVADRMTREVRTLGRNDKLVMADELMKEGGFRHVVVLEGGEVVGVVTQRDLFYGALAWSTGVGRAAHRKALEALPVKQVMRTDVVTIGPDASLGEAAERMLEGRVGCLPVLAAEGLVGILTEGDFLSMLTEAEVRAQG